MNIKSNIGRDTGKDLNRPEIVIEECKGCGRCVRACPHGFLRMSVKYNCRGYHYVEYTGEDCSGCGLCFYSCPEPHAMRLFRVLKKKNKR